MIKLMFYCENYCFQIMQKISRAKNKVVHQRHVLCVFSSTCSFIQYFTPSSIHSYICSLEFVRSLIRLFVCPFARSFIYSFVRSFVRSFMHSFHGPQFQANGNYLDLPNLITMTLIKLIVKVFHA